MPLLKVKPTSPGRRALVKVVTPELYKGGPFVALTSKQSRTNGRNNHGRVTIGEVGNAEHNLESIGKAGRKRWRGIRPTVRGVAMNPIDHPHGGGEGRTSSGQPPVSPWGVQTKGFKTRRNKRTQVMIVRDRRVK